MIELFKKSALYRFVFANESLLQFVKFGIVGLGNTAISLSIYYIFIAINPKLYLVGNFAGWIIGVLNAFYWGNRVVFKKKDGESRNLFYCLIRCYMTYGVSFVLKQGLLYLQVSMWGVSEWVAPIINLVISIPLNFVLNKFWTFRDTD